jgi:hypothetical protein
MKTKLTEKGLDTQLSNPEDSHLEIVADKIILSGKDLHGQISKLEKEVLSLKEELKKQCSFLEFEKEIQSIRKDIEKLGKKEKVSKE